MTAAVRGPGLTALMRHNDRAAIPLFLASPFLNFPKLLEGDTQPWVLAGMALSLLFFRPRFRRNDPLLVIALLCGACILAVYARAQDPSLFIRYAYIYAMFALLYLVLRDTSEHAVRWAVRYTITVWFAFGAYQYLALLLGLPVEFAGRFVEGRSGIPGILAEPSFFGSFSALGAIVLLRHHNRSDLPFIGLAALNVLMSGSIISFAFLALFVIFLSFRAMLGAIAAVAALFYADLAFGSGGLLARLASFQNASTIADVLYLDASTNLRLGAIVFTLWDSVGDLLFFSVPMEFMYLYNNYAARSGVFIATGSDFIVASAGDIIFSSGIFGLLLLGIATSTALRIEATRMAGLRKLIVLLACFVNPISLSHPLFVLLLVSPELGQRQTGRPEGSRRSWNARRLKVPA